MHRYQDDNTVMATQDYIVLTSPMLKIEYRVDKSAFMTAYKKKQVDLRAVWTKQSSLTDVYWWFDHF